MTASSQYIYVMQGLTKTFPGGKPLFQDIGLSFFHGSKIGVIGTNGTGKTTLMKIMAGLDQEFEGEAWAAQGASVGFLAQEPALDSSLTVEENILKSFSSTQILLAEFEAVNSKFTESLTAEQMETLLARQADLQEQIDAVDGWNVERQIHVAMAALRCPPGDRAITHLSGGEKRRVALCQLLLQQPDILLLDEPTNHLDVESVAWLESFLQSYRGTVILVTHDRYFLDNVVGWILELDRGRAFPFRGNYSSWAIQKQKRLIQEGRAEDARQKTLARELEWMRQSPKARQVKNKARIASYEDLFNSASRDTAVAAQIIIPPGPRLGNLVIEAEAICKSFGDRCLIKDLSFSLPPGGIVGVIGPNGAGKTTLFRMITQHEQPDRGRFRLGETVKLGYVDQSRDALCNDRTVWEEISDELEHIDFGHKTIASRAYCGFFNFKGIDQQKKVGLLSGGERNRVHLAKLLKTKINLLLLDEPTNDLDVETLRALEEALVDFAGCAVVISHDRWFLDRVATHILAFEGRGHVVWFEGNYAAYEQDRNRRFGKAV